MFKSDGKSSDQPPLAASVEAGGETLLSPIQDEFFRSLVDAVNDYAIFGLDAQGRVLSWNAGAKRLKGYAADEVIGSHFSRFYTVEDLARGHPQWELAEATMKGTYEEEGWRIRKDGARFWANVVITALRDASGNLRGFAKVTRDLTARRANEERLRQNEERFRLMIEGVKDYAIFMLDSSGRVTTWNEGAVRNKGYQAEEIIGEHFSKFYLPADVIAGKPEYELREAENVGRFEDTGWRVRKEGTLFWANVIITAVHDISGKLIGYSKVTRDLTERKAAEDRLHQAYRDLEDRVVQRTAELEYAKEKAESAVRTRDEFLSIASHELRTPLTSLKLKSELAKRQLTPELGNTAAGARFRKYVLDTDEQLNRLARLVEDMLDLTRLSHGRLPLNRQRVDLGEVARSAVDRMSVQFRERAVRVDCAIAPDIHVEVDRVRIEQVLFNLFTNALRYAPGSPIRLEVGVEDGVGRIRVGDEGPGISAKNQARIFNRYERLVASDHISGLGIGLYLSRSIVNAHGGSIRVESALGEGARFIVDIPLAPPI